MQDQSPEVGDVHSGSENSRDAQELNRKTGDVTVSQAGTWFSIGKANK